MKQSKNTVKSKLILTLAFGLIITGSAINSNVNAMLPSRTDVLADSHLLTTSPNEQEFSEIQATSKKRTSIFDHRRDRYKDIGSVGRQNSKRTSYVEKEYITKNRNVINASKIVKETIGGKKFSIIATQAPMESTIDAFWDLIFYGKHVNDIVVLGNPWINPDTPNSSIQDYWSPKAILKSHKYEITCEIKLISKSANKSVVTITDKSTGKSKKDVNIYNYFAWPDMGLPTRTYDFINFVSMFKDTRKLVVHSSAGVGRTGTFSACLEVLRKGAKNVNVKDIVMQMRTHRTSMVQNLEQYLFVKEYQKHHAPITSTQKTRRKSHRQKLLASKSTRRQSAANTSTLNETSNTNPLAVSRAAGSPLSDIPNPLKQSTRHQPAASASALNETFNPHLSILNETLNPHLSGLDGTFNLHLAVLNETFNSPLAVLNKTFNPHLLEVSLSDMPNPIEQSRCPKPLRRPSTRRQSAANTSALNETSNTNPLAVSRAAGSTLSDMSPPLHNHVSQCH